jgi:hypothetical protein
MYLNIIKAKYDNTLLNGEKLKPFSLKSGTKQGYPHSPPVQHSPGIPSQSIRQEEEIKGIQIGKETVKIW